MNHLQRLLAACLALILLFGPAQAFAKKTYKGADAGYLVYSVSALKYPILFYFDYRKLPIDVQPKWQGSMDCNCQGMLVGMFPGKMDFKGHDTGGRDNGNVLVERLPAGQYEIYTYSVLTGSAARTVTSTPKRDFSIPFTIQPGQATYIGNIARGCCLGTTYISYFVFSDQSERDLSIARIHEPALPEVTKQIMDISQVHNPLFFTSDPN